MSVALIGYRGSGKSSIGRKLADRLWWTFVDLDELIVRKAGLSIREIFEKSGEEGFRDLEADALREVAGRSDHVLALGGGAVLREGNRMLLTQGGTKVVYLRCEPAVLLKRIQADAATAAMRPNLTTLGGGIEEIQSLLARREPIYRELADVELDVTNLTVDEAVVRLTRLV